MSLPMLIDNLMESIIKDKYKRKEKGDNQIVISRWRLYISAISFFVFIMLFLREVKINIKWNYSIFLIFLFLSAYMYKAARVYTNRGASVLNKGWSKRGKEGEKGEIYYWSLIHPFIYWISITLSFLFLLPFWVFERIGITAKSILIAIAIFIGVIMIFLSKINILAKFGNSVMTSFRGRTRKENFAKVLIYTHLLLILSFVLEALAFICMFYFFGFSSGKKIELALMYITSLALSYISPLEGGVGIKELVFSLLALVFFHDSISIYPFTIFSYSLLYLISFVTLSFVLKERGLKHPQQP